MCVCVCVILTLATRNPVTLDRVGSATGAIPVPRVPTYLINSMASPHMLSDRPLMNLLRPKRLTSSVAKWLD